MQRRSLVGWVFTVALLALVLGVAGYIVWLTSDLEFHPGRLSGEGFDSPYRVLLAMLVAGLVYALAAATRTTTQAMATPLLPLVGFAAVCLAWALYRSYDDYFFPQLYRVSAVTNLPGWSLALLAAGAVAAGFVAWRRPRAGLLAEGVFLWIAVFWIFFLGPFH